MGRACDAVDRHAQAVVGVSETLLPIQRPSGLPWPHDSTQIAVSLVTMQFNVGAAYHELRDATAVSGPIAPAPSCTAARVRSVSVVERLGECSKIDSKPLEPRPQ